MDGVNADLRFWGIWGFQRMGRVNADLQFWGNGWGSECRFKVLGGLGVPADGGSDADVRFWGSSGWGQ